MYFRNVKKTAGDISISEPIDSDGDGNSITLMDIFSDEESMIDEINLKMNAKKMYGYIDTCLEEREKTIIALRYGLNAIRPLTQREIAKKLKISRSYVSRIEKKALEKLKDAFDKNEKK